MSKILTPQETLNEVFSKQPPEFAEGFETGKLYFTLKNKQVILDMNILTSNKETVEALCKHFGYTYKFTNVQGSIASLTAHPSIVCQN